MLKVVTCLEGVSFEFLARNMGFEMLVHDNAGGEKHNVTSIRLYTCRLIRP